MRSFYLFFLFLLPRFVFSQRPDYNHDIAPIIIKHCTPCHRDGEIGAMPFTSYEEVKAYGKMITFVTQSHYMPPWSADDTYNHYKNENLLNPEEITLISKWVDSGMARGFGNAPIYGDGKVKQVAFEPDTVIAMKSGFEQYGIYYDQYQAFVLPYNGKKEEMVQAIQFVPGNRDIVRHAIISIDTTDKSDSLDRWDPRYGYFSYNGLGFEPKEYAWYDWSPNQGADLDFNKILPAKCKIIIHIYYGPTGIIQRDSSFIQLKFKKSRSGVIIKSVLLLNENSITNPPFEILPNEEKYFNASLALDKDVRIYSVFPVANLLCKSFELFAKLPDGKVQKLLRIKDWNFHWQRKYIFEEAMMLPAGTKIQAIVRYDNRPTNDANPSLPPIKMTAGYHMFKEQFKVYFDMEK